MTRRVFTASLQILLLAIAGCSAPEIDSHDADRTVGQAGERTLTRAASLTDESFAGSDRPAALPAADAEFDATAEPVSTAPTPAVVERPQDPRAAGRAAFEAGDYETAARMLEYLSEDGTAGGYDLYLLGLSLWKSGDPARAEGFLEQAAWKMERFSRARVNLARVRMETGDLAGARKAIEEALEIDGSFSPALNVLGRVLLASGDRDGAFEAFRRAAEADPQNPWPLNNLGYELLRQGEAAAAKGALEQAVERRQDIAIIWNNLAHARERTGDLAGAAAAATQAAELSGGEASSYAPTARRLAALAPDATTPAVEVRPAMDLASSRESDTSAELPTALDAAEGDRQH